MKRNYDDYTMMKTDLRKDRREEGSERAAQLLMRKNKDGKKKMKRKEIIEGDFRKRKKESETEKRAYSIKQL